MNQKPLCTWIRGAAAISCAIVSVTLASVVTRKLSFANEIKRKKVLPPCSACRGQGFYICKLCKGNATLKWSPLYDLIATNACLCPTCEGNRIQRCLNCLGKGYE